ncbi:multidrug effflux MFS transporter [Roseibium sp. CAU 1637]|uniref:Bcr/CflA family efflux transporter n=1 Tax=Roseibium limicola TaxID=2816037 RepID=A0A939EPB4_9HYPH|nr:multidrug effflux MFS transporter [Roseibium limicola]MBO0345033.1 multidrug effflux MFS transporter [Roseibium limicola]
MSVSSLEADRQSRRRSPSLLMLVAMSMVAPVSMNMYLPSMSAMARSFQTSAGMIQLTMSLFFASVALAQIVTGPLSDRFGRRPVAIGGMVLFCIGSTLCLLAPSVEFLIVARMVQAAGGCTGLVLSRAIVRDLYERDKAASMLGYVTMGMAVGPMSAPLIGGVLQTGFGWQGSFYFMLTMGLVVLTLALRFLPETHHQRASGFSLPKLAGSYRELVRQPLFRSYALAVMFTSSVYFAYLGGTPFLAAGRLAMSAQVMGLYFMSIALGYMLGNFLSGRYAQRIGSLRMVMVGSFLPVVAVIALAVFAGIDFYHPLTLFGPMFFIGFGNGLCLPSAISGAVSVRPDLAGAASGLVGSLQMGLGALSSALVAHMLSGPPFADSAWPMVIVMGLCVLLTWVSVYRIAQLEPR